MSQEQQSHKEIRNNKIGTFIGHFVLAAATVFSMIWFNVFYMKLLTSATGINCWLFGFIISVIIAFICRGEEFPTPENNG